MYRASERASERAREREREKPVDDAERGHTDEGRGGVVFCAELAHASHHPRICAARYKPVCVCVCVCVFVCVCVIVCVIVCVCVCVLECISIRLCLPAK